MFSIFKKKSREKVPKWASFFNSEEYLDFVNLVEEYFKNRDLKVGLEDGVVIIEGGEEDFGLVNLAQICKQEERSKWRDLVREHFDQSGT